MPTNAKRVIYYYQTLTDLTPILQLVPQPVTHIILASIHFGKDPSTNNPYIHLNNYNPTDSKFDNVWKQLTIAKRNHGIDIRLMIGGAGGAYTDLFSNYAIYYPMLVELLTKGPAASIVTGVDLDIEEPTSLDNIRRLIQDLHCDIPDLKFTMAPVASSLYLSSGGSMAGFKYTDLLRTTEGKLIEWFNGQYYYGDFDVNHFDQTVQNLNGLATPSQIVMGTETGQWAPDEWQKCYDILQAVSIKYPTMGGTFFWEYYIRPQDWETNVEQAMTPPPSTIISSLSIYRSGQQSDNSYCSVM